MQFKKDDPLFPTNLFDVEWRWKWVSDDGDWYVVEDEQYCGGFGCTPDGCLGHSTGRGTWVDGPAIVEEFEAGMDESESETNGAYHQACRDAEAIANAPRDIAFLLDQLKKRDELLRVLLTEDPDAAIADGGHTVLDMWRHEVRKLLEPTS